MLVRPSRRGQAPASRMTAVSPCRRGSAWWARFDAMMNQRRRMTRVSDRYMAITSGRSRGRVTGGEPVTDGFEAWFKRAAHQIESLMAVTNLAQNALISGIAAIRSAVESIRLDSHRRPTLAGGESLPGPRDR